jgi:small-conductance mechanosensitive channel
MELLGTRLVGLNQETAFKLALSAGLLVLLALVTIALRFVLRHLAGSERAKRVRFWGRQAVSLTVAVVLIAGLVSIWFDDPRRVTAALGLLSAGLAVALQKVVTSMAGYFVILRGKTFTVGDRISMGGVRGDVVALGFFQTTILEMGQPPAVQSADPAMWVRSRQFTGRIVTVANSRIFDEPVYNYTREFPFLWEELAVPIAYRDDRRRAEQAMLAAGRRHAVDPASLDEDMVDRLRRNYGIERSDFEPRVYWRITDNWMELTLRILIRDHGTREVKDAITRDLIGELDACGIGIASATVELSGVAQVELRRPARQRPA